MGITEGEKKKSSIMYNLKNVFLRVKKTSLQNLWSWSKSQHLFLVIYSVLGVFLGAMSVVLSLITKGMIDSVTQGNIKGLFYYAIGLLLIILLEQIIGFFNNILQVKIRARITNELRTQILEAVLEKEYASISGYHSGDLTNRMFSDVGVVVEGIVGVVPTALIMATQMIGALFILFQMDSRFVVVLLIIAFVLCIAMLLPRNKMKQFNKEVQQKYGAVQSVLQETLQNLRIVKAADLGQYMKEKAEDCQQEHYDCQIRQNRFNSSFRVVLNLLFDGSWLLAMVWGCVGIYQQRFTYGTLTAIMQLVGKVQGPVANLSGIAGRLFAASASAERIQELLQLPNEKKEEEETTEKTIQEFESLSVNNVDFTYNASNGWILKQLSFCMKKGDFIAITGLSGAGKSTLFLLLLGVYQPVHGNIKFLSEKQEYKAGRKTRKFFAYVPQGNGLFSGTLLQNLTMFCPSASMEQVDEALKAACIYDFVYSLPKKLESKIGERGIGLSEGQGQRIAVARALISGAPILLLDEATSALDEETEAQLLKNISKLKNRSCLIVTHRKAALKICNKQIQIGDL